MPTETYIPRLATIEDIQIETNTEKTFTFRLPDDDPGMHFKPGQFVELSVIGAGEAPFGLASSPALTHVFQSTVRRYAAGVVTIPLHRMQVGDYVGVRGPLGNGFPLADNRGRDILIIGGGLGLPTLRATIFYILDHREDFGSLTLLYGARTPEDRVYKNDLQDWTDAPGINCLQTVDMAHEDWGGNVGYVPQLIEQISLQPSNTVAFMCGPAVMIKPCVAELEGRGVSAEQMFINMEAHMKCGIGKCGHCLIRDKYVCLDGPVFPYDKVRQLQQFQDGI